MRYVAPCARKNHSVQNRRARSTRSVSLQHQPCRPALQSRRRGVPGAFLNPKDREDLWQHLDRSLFDLLGIETAERVRNHRVAVIGVAITSRHGVSRGGKGMGNDRCRWNASLLEDRTVGQTGRAARASITYSGNNDITLFDHLISELVRNGVGESVALRAHDDRLQGVALFE